ncbi:hypothetical protein [Methylosinus sp. C49]|uniref:hypothetical protein n=1 Tax=Methylosinus sp. C49 TaxID=2699395 RepID=UPI001379F220|nr:hypothetical protein [Methylosinus sp. C49]
MNGSSDLLNSRHALMFECLQFSTAVSELSCDEYVKHVYNVVLGRDPEFDIEFEGVARLDYLLTVLFSDESKHKHNNSYYHKMITFVEAIGYKACAPFVAALLADTYPTEQEFRLHVANFEEFRLPNTECVPRLASISADMEALLLLSSHSFAPSPPSPSLSPPLEQGAARSIAEAIFQAIVKRGPSEPTLDFHARRLIEDFGTVVDLVREAVEQQEVRIRSASITAALEDFRILHRSTRARKNGSSGGGTHGFSLVDAPTEQPFEPRPMLASDLAIFHALSKNASVSAERESPIRDHSVQEASSLVGLAASSKLRRGAILESFRHHQPTKPADQIS